VTLVGLHDLRNQWRLTILTSEFNLALQLALRTDTGIAHILLLVRFARPGKVTTPVQPPSERRVC
jgi:hypothetical protein